MVKIFQDWLMQIVEDDPLPDEIDHVLFSIKQNGKYKFVYIKGYEKKIDVNAIAYFPLEAQFFKCRELAVLDENIIFERVKYLIDESFSSLILKQQIKNKKIYLEFKNNFEYLFKV